MTDIVVRVAETDDDIIAMHRFLCVLAGPALPGPIDARDSVHEMHRLTKHDVALMAMKGDLLVGTLGLAFMSFWWNTKIQFLGNRWLFAIPGSGAWRPLLEEARAIGVGSGLEVHIASEERGTLTILNKSKKRENSLVLRKPTTDRLHDNVADHDPSVVDDAGCAK